MQPARRRSEEIEQRQAEPEAAADMPQTPAADLLQLQRTAGNGAVSRMLQRLLRPAIVKEKAGVHDYAPQAGGDDRVKGGGFRGGDLLGDDKLQKDSTLLADPHRTDGKHVWAEVGALRGYVKGKYLRYGEQLSPGATFWLAPEPNEQFSIWDAATREHLKATGTKAVLPNDVQADFVESVKNVLRAEARTGVDVADKGGLVAQIAKNTMMGIKPRPELWREATGEIDKVKARVQRDKAELVAAGLITNRHSLKSVEFTGADFHKHGKAPFFLRFERDDPLNPQPVKLVYKPADLTVDRTIFGRGNRDDSGAATPSVAESMDPGGGAISQYTILTKADAGEHYSIMEFVRSGGPSSAAELLSVYRSLGANMALSYVVGLEDVHEENVLLLDDRIQVIDMEATTGLFKKKNDASGAFDPSAGGFKDQVWLQAIMMAGKGIKAKLEDRASQGQLTAAPDTATVGPAALAAFTAALNAAAKGSADERFQTLEAQLATSSARVVPIATKDFYNLIRKAEDHDTLHKWRQAVDADRDILVQAKGAAKEPPSDDFLRRLLKLPGTYEALRRGEVPYYSRSLSSDEVLDELGNNTPGTGLAKVGGPIDEEMEGRRQELKEHGFGKARPGRGQDPAQAAAVRIFQAQVVPALQAVNDSVRRLIAQRAGGGGGG